MSKVNAQPTRVKGRDYVAGKVRKGGVDFLNGWNPARSSIPKLTDAEYRCIMRIDSVEEYAERDRHLPKGQGRKYRTVDSRNDTQDRYYVPGDPIDPTVSVGLVMCMSVRSVMAKRLLRNTPTTARERVLKQIDMIGPDDPLPFVVRYYDLRPEWIQVILDNLDQHEFNFSTVSEEF